jgi:ribosomal-protein-alanine N-acetyltransferase
MRIGTERLTLRTLERDDSSALRDFYLRNKAFFAPWEPARDDRFFEPGSFEEAIDAERRELAERRSLKLYLFERAEAGSPPPIVGYAGLSNIVHGAFLSAFLGYKVDEAHRGKGYMTEGLRALVDAAFGEYGLHRIEANIIPRNAPSVRLALRLGFVLEGSSPKYLRINGVWEDHDHYVLRNAALE